MHCKNCGNEYESDSQYCSNCGSVTNTAYSYKVYNTMAYIIGLLFSPLVGLVMGIIGVSQRKKHAWSIVIVAVIGWLFNVLVM